MSDEAADAEHRVPEVVRNRALLAGADAWLEGLPDLIAALEAEWSITVGAPFGDATEAYVASATLASGEPAVLKLVIPRDSDAARDEITVLALAGGSGCVRLLRSDVGRSALLIERLGRSLYEVGLPVRRRQEILCAAASAIWRPAPGAALETGAERARWLLDYVPRAWEELDRPCSAEAVDHAVACGEARLAAHDDERAVLLHGDVHQWNALESGDGFLLVDPDGVLGEPEYDLGNLMSEDPDELLEGDPWDRARWLAARCRLDATAIWEWGAIHRVANGLHLTRIDLQPVGRAMLAAADHVARWHP